MIRWVILVLAAWVGLSGVMPARAVAETVLERIARTGRLVAGARENAIPFAFWNESGDPVGFSLDLVRSIHQEVMRRLERPVELVFVPIDTRTRLDFIESGEIDINCGITTATWAREERVDFSMPIFVDGARIVAFRSEATSLTDLAEARLGAIQDTTTVNILKEKLPRAEIVSVKDLPDGFNMLSRQQIDGFANVGVVLRAQLETYPFKSRLVMLPRVGQIAREAMSCVLPSNDSAWRDLVNHTLSDLLEGIEEYRGGYYRIYERWFGPAGQIFYPLSKEAANELAVGRMWLD